MKLFILFYIIAIIVMRFLSISGIMENVDKETTSSFRIDRRTTLLKAEKQE